MCAQARTGVRKDVCAMRAMYAEQVVNVAPEYRSQRMGNGTSLGSTVLNA